MGQNCILGIARDRNSEVELPAINMRQSSGIVIDLNYRTEGTAVDQRLFIDFTDSLYTVYIIYSNWSSLFLKCQSYTVID